MNTPFSNLLLFSFGIALILSAPQLDAQHLAWMELYGGVYHDAFYDGAPTSDGGVITVGMSRSYKAFSAQFQSVYVAKTDANGNRVWHRPLSSYVSAKARRILPLDEDHWLLVGSTVSLTDSNIGVLWTARLSSEGFLDRENAIDVDRGFSVQEAITLRDGNILVVGSKTVSQREIVTMKLTSEGELLWMHTLDDPNVLNSSPSRVIELDGGDCILTATVSQAGDGRYYLFMQRLSPDGDMLWTKIHRAPTNDYFVGMVQVGPNELVLVGGRDVGLSNLQILLARVDTDGNMLAEPRVLDTVGTLVDVIYREDIGLIAVGAGGSPQEIIYTQLDRALNVLRYQTFPSLNLSSSVAYDVDFTADGSVVMTGESTVSAASNGLVMKLSDLTSGVEPFVSFWARKELDLK